MKYRCLMILLLMMFSCDKNDDFPTGVSVVSDTVGCESASYGPWETSSFVLPYPVGETYKTGLTNCSGSYHSEGLPDQFAFDFDMQIGTLITSSKPGRVVYVEESGEDFKFPDNVVVVSHGGNNYTVYAHLTKNGALVNVGDNVGRGDAIGYSGATGLAGYPHLHFVNITSSVNDDWYPYHSNPINFKNTSPNPRGLKQKEFYEALSY